jgi:saccharopine dehydrogenase-like NADP-dependent oxidoreductase
VPRGRGGDFPYSPKTILSELLDPAVVYRNGQYLEVPALSGREIIHFPEPVGTRIGFYAIHSEIATLPTHLPSAREVVFKNTWTEGFLDKVQFLTALGLTSTAPIPFGKK